MKKTPDDVQISMRPTVDILAELSRRSQKKRLTVGFALETHDAESNARSKLKKKSLDLVVLNEYTAKNKVFGSDVNAVTIIPRSGKKKKYPPRQKSDVARILVDTIVTML